MKRNLINAITIFLICLTISIPKNIAKADSGDIELVSLAYDGTESNGTSTRPVVSADGRFVAFHSGATNLVDDDTNARNDVFVYDRMTGDTTLVSVSSTGQQGAENAGYPSISDDGRFIVFNAKDSLVPEDTNGLQDIYLSEWQIGEISLITNVSEGDSGDYGAITPVISGNGQFITFVSYDNNLVPDDTNGVRDIFVHDLQTGETKKISEGYNGEQANGLSRSPTISADGQYIVFSSIADNLVLNDTNDTWDIFVYSQQTGEIKRVSVNSEGEQANNASKYRSTSISDDGQYITYASQASNLVSNDINGNISDIFIYDQQTGETDLISVSSTGEQADHHSYYSAISGDGRYITFSSGADNLDPECNDYNTHIFVHDRFTGKTTLVTKNMNGVPGNDDSWYLDISADGKHVVFSTLSNNLVYDDNNGKEDIFIRDISDFSGASWLLIYYQAGDNDTHNALMTELEDIVSVENSNIDIAIFHDASKESNLDSSYRFHSHSGEKIFISKGELNSGDGSTLVDFINWAKSQSNASNIALILSDHGHALNGFGVDETSSDQLLVNSELSQALGSSGFFDVIYLHACLMANMEFVYQIRGLTDYYVASESISWAPLKHSTYLTSITFETSAEDLAILMASEYNEHFSNYDQFPINTPSTISVMDMFYFDEAVAKTHNLAWAILNTDNQTKTDIWNILTSTNSVLQRYDDASDQNNVNDPGDILVDLYHIADIIKHIQPVKLEAEQLLATKNNLIVFEKNWSTSTRDYTNSNGITIAFPTKPTSFYSGDWVEFAQGADWSSLTSSSINQLSREGSFYWGPMISEFVMTFNPNELDQSTPPKLVSLFYVHKTFLPMIVD